MSRPRKPHFRESDGWWVSMFRGARIKLAKGKEHKDAALKRFHELMAVEAIATPPESPDATMASLCEAFLAWSAKHNVSSTYEFYQMFLQDFCTTGHGIRVVDLKPFHVTRWLDGHATWGSATRRCAITAMKRILNWAVDEGLIQVNPIKKVKKPMVTRRDRILTAAERKRIAGAIKDKAFKLWIFALGQTGCRPGEVSRVGAQDFDPNAGTWTFPEHKTAGKTGKPRIVYLTPPMITLCLRLASQHPTGPLFRNSRGVAWTRNAVRCRFRRLRKTLKLPAGVIAYTYRHTFATEGLANGVPIAMMAELLGHVDTKMISEHYGHLQQKTDQLRQAAQLATRTVPAASA